MNCDPRLAKSCKSLPELGVRLKIISGDNPHTVAALARQTGMVIPKLVTGPELAAMSVAEFERAAEEATIFGRIGPKTRGQTRSTP